MVEYRDRAIPGNSSLGYFRSYLFPCLARLEALDDGHGVQVDGRQDDPVVHSVQDGAAGHLVVGKCYHSLVVY